MNPRLTVARFIAAIDGSGGIKARICAAVPCALETLNGWMGKHPTIKAAYEAECSRMLDIAHSVVQNNILAAQREQGEGEEVQIVDSTDAKWYLARKGRHQGFGKELSIEHSLHPVTLSDWRKQAERRKQEVEDLED